MIAIIIDTPGINSQGSVPLLKDGDYSCDSNVMVDGDVFTYPYYVVKESYYDVCGVKIMQPMTPDQNYFELKILCPGVLCAVTIGTVGCDYPLNRHPGWEKEGIGYHADDGKLYNEHPRSDEILGPTCTIGDRMGCGVDFESEGSPNFVKVFFTKNGKQVGDFIKFKKPKSGLYPLMGMHSRGEQFQYLGHWCYLPKQGKHMHNQFMCIYLDGMCILRALNNYTQSS